MNIPNEQELVQRSKAGDGAAFESLIEACAPELRRAIDASLSEQWRVLFSSEDAFQEALTEAFRSFAQFEWKGPGSFYAWLKRLAINGMTDEIRKLLAVKRKPPQGAPVSTTESMVVLIDGLCDPDQATPSRITMRDEAVTLFRSALAKLPRNQRRAVELYDLEGRDVGDAARIMQGEFERETGRKRKVAIHVLRFRAFAQLREALSNQASIFQRL